MSYLKLVTAIIQLAMFVMKWVEQRKLINEAEAKLAGRLLDETQKIIKRARLASDDLGPDDVPDPADRDAAERKLAGGTDQPGSGVQNVLRAKLQQPAGQQRNDPGDKEV